LVPILSPRLCLIRAKRDLFASELPQDGASKKTPQCSRFEILPQV
jgi:hypothetical protein